MTLSLVVITNKEKLQEKFLRRLSFADEVIFVYEKNRPALDKVSSKTVFLPTGPQSSFADKRNLGLKKAKGEWVLFVDDDEIVSNELAKEIVNKIKDKNISGYYLTRYDLCFYQELKFGEVKNQKILRLAKSGSGEFGRSVHEVWHVRGKRGYLISPLYHQKDYFISGFLDRIRQYGPTDADCLNQEKKAFTYFKLLALPKFKFLNNYFLKLGFMDGYPGLFLAYLMSVQSLSVRIFQWEKKSSR